MIKKLILPILFILLTAVVSFNVGAASTVPASGVAYENGSTTTTVKDSLDDLISKTKVGTATAAQILSGKTALVQGATVTGTMTDQGAKTASLNAGGSYTIPAGYHNGSGKVTANSLASQTSATATAAQILSGQTAYVSGSKITGTMTNRGAVTSTLNAGGSYTIPAGYHNGSGKVTANSIASQTSATATAADIASGKTAYVNGSKITGTGYKTYTFKDVSATVSNNPAEFTGSYVKMATEKFYNCSGDSCDADGYDSTFSIDLGFTPSSVLAATVYLTCPYDTGPFRISRGYASGTTTAQYWYLTKLQASYPDSYNLDLRSGTSDTTAYNELKVQISGSTLKFIVSTSRMSWTNGTTTGAYYTNCNGFKLTGTVVYK